MHSMSVIETENLPQLTPTATSLLKVVNCGKANSVAHQATFPMDPSSMLKFHPAKHANPFS